MAPRASWRRTALRLAGGAILVFGLWGAATIYRQAADRLAPDIEAPGDVAAVLHPEDFKRASRDMEAFGGKSMLAIEQARRWLTGPAGARALAILAGLGALVVGAGLILAADRLPDETAANRQDPPPA